MYCENCGRQISDGSQKCEYCGQAAGSNPYMEAGPANYPQENNAQQGNYSPLQPPPAEVYNPYGQNPGQGNYPPQQNNVTPQNPGFYNNTVPTPRPVKQASAIGSGIGSLVIAVICFFVFGWLSFLGLGLGITAIATARKSTSRAAGLVLGILGTIINSIWVILWIFG